MADNSSADTLSMAQPAIRVAQPWLLEQIPAFAGGGEPADALAGLFKLQVANRPVVRSLKELYKLNKRDLPPNIAALKGDVYLVTHAVGLIAKEHAGWIDMVGYEASFEGEGTTVELFPNTRFKEYFTAKLRFEAGISADGFAEVPQVSGSLGNDVVKLGGGAEIRLSTKAEALGNLTFSIQTPKVQTIGNASSTIAWQFNQDDHPLVGDQVMVQTLLVPKGFESVKYTLKAFAVIPRWFRRPVRIETEPVVTTVRLP